MNKKSKKKKPHARATYTFETSKEILRAIAEVYNGMKSGEIDDGTAKARGYVLQVAGGLYRTCEIERRIDAVELKLVEVENGR